MSDLVKRLRIKAGMIEMGELIAWGSDVALMREAADALDHAAVERKKVGRPQIREVFMRNGFTIKPGHDDLKDYVYEAAFDLLETAAPAVQREPIGFCEDTALSLAERTFSSEVDEQLAEDVIRYARRLHDLYTAPQPAPDVACNQSRESSMVVLERDADGKPTVWCDPEIADLVSALNKAGIRTVASCSGHGHRPGNIMLADGRELVIARDFDEARKIDAMFPGINGEPPMVDVAGLVEALTELCDEIDNHDIHSAISKTNILWFKRKARAALAPYRKGGEA